MFADPKIFIVFLFLICGFYACGGTSASSDSGNSATAAMTSVVISPSNPSLAINTTQQFAATGIDENNTSYDLTTAVAWSSSDNNIATIDSSGLVTTVAAGTASITGTYQEQLADSTTLTVLPTATALTLTPSNPSLAVGSPQTVVATATFSDNTTQIVTSLASWASSNTLVANVDNADSKGLVTALASGTTTITATYDGLTASITVTVLASEVTLASIAIAPLAQSLAKGLTLQYAATGTYSNASTATITEQVTWSSSNEAIATINSAGLATAVAEGVTTITATKNGVSTTTSLTITAATLSSIAVTPATPSKAKGLTQQFVATGTYSDATTVIITTQVTWSTANGAVATISNTDGSRGQATAAGVGGTTITATDAATGKTGSTGFTVTSAALVSLAVTPANPSLPDGAPQQFIATGTYTDATTETITTTVTWSSSNDAIATISNAGGSQGLATSVSQGGPITITATHVATGISGTTGLTITAPSVLPLYPNNGSNWNDYVSNNGASVYTADDTSCTGYTGSGDYDTCLNGGEKRMVYVADENDCTGLAATDSRGAFDWSCDASTTPVRMVSQGLKSSKNLSDLIDFDGVAFKTNTVSVTDGGSAVFTTAAATWWSNTVSVDNDGGALDIAGNIYLITSAATASYTIENNRIGILVKPGVIMKGPGTGQNLFYANNQYLLWMEGVLDVTGDSRGLSLSSVRRSHFRNLTVANASAENKTGIYLTGSLRNKFTNVQIVNNHNKGLEFAQGANNNSFNALTVSGNGTSNTGVGIYFNTTCMCYNNVFTNSDIVNNYRGIDINEYSYGNMFDTVNVSHNSTDGVRLLGQSYENVFYNFFANNNGGDGIYINSGDANIFVNVVTANNGWNGIEDIFANSSDNIFVNVTTANNFSQGFSASNSADHLLVMNLVSVNNQSYGCMVNSGENTFANLVCAHDQQTEVYVSGNSNRFTGLLKVDGAGTKCYVDPGATNPGLVDTTCANQGSSDATLTNTADLASSFVDKVIAEDTANTTDTLGKAAASAELDWVNFDNAFRNWGFEDANAFPNASHRGNLGCSDPYYHTEALCTGAGETWDGAGQIWDWSADALDDQLHAVLAKKVAGSAANALTHIWSDATTSTFLRNAMEILHDDIGNDDGLCESGETCLYTPNIGAYQGHGNLETAGVFTNGDTLTDITLQQHETNGY